MIRKALLKDLPSILVILSEAKAFLKASGSIQWNGEAGNPDETMLKNDIKLERLYVLEEDGKILGSIVLQGHEKEYDNPYGEWMTDGLSYTTVHRIMVSKEARCHGIATRLLMFAEEYTKKVGRESIRIDTHPENLIVQTMLRTLGYTNCGYVIYSYIPKEAKRLIYEKVLN